MFMYFEARNIYWLHEKQNNGRPALSYNSIYYIYIVIYVQINSVLNNQSDY